MHIHKASLWCLLPQCIVAWVNVIYTTGLLLSHRFSLRRWQSTFDITTKDFPNVNCHWWSSPLLSHINVGGYQFCFLGHSRICHTGKMPTNRQLPTLRQQPQFHAPLLSDPSVTGTPAEVEPSLMTLHFSFARLRLSALPPLSTSDTIFLCGRNLFRRLLFHSDARSFWVNVEH